jgi:hypothetical protein
VAAPRPSAERELLEPGEATPTTRATVWEVMQHDEDERVAISLDPDDALRALLKVDPQAEPVEDDPAPPHGDSLMD